MPCCALTLRYPVKKETDRMTRRYLRIALLGSLVSLTACAQQSEVKQMHQSISTLSSRLSSRFLRVIYRTSHDSIIFYIIV